MSVYWGLAALLSLGSFLPFALVKSRPARIIFGLLAAGVDGLMLYFLSAAAAPNSGLVAFAMVDIASVVGLAAYALFVIGCAIGLSRLIVARTGLPVALVSVVLVVVTLIPAFWVPYRGWQWQAARMYASNDAIIAAARDTVRPQSKQQLEQRVLSALRPAPSTSTSEGAVWVAAEELVRLWHPGPLKNDSFLEGQPIANYDQREHIVKGVWDDLLAYYLDVHDQYSGTGSLHAMRSSDVLRARWAAPISWQTIASQDWYDAKNLKFHDGRQLFASEPFQRLDVVRSREGTTEPFMTFYVVDDAGRWWLVGAINPNLHLKQ